MARAGGSEVYSEADQLLEMLLGMRLSRSQVFRVTSALGEALPPMAGQAQTQSVAGRAV